MRYVCPKCGEIFPVPPPNNSCPICDATIITEPGSHEPESHGEREGLPSPKRRF